MPGLSGTDLQKELQRQNHSIPLIFITGHGDIPMSVQAMKNGAVDFLTKPYNDEDLLRAIGRALEKDQKHRHAQEKRASIQERVDTLTPAEQDVLRWLITGKLNKQIARKLGIKEKTVRVHRGRVLKKMKASSIADLVRFTHTVFIDPPQE
jgi:FixJ family two-component response regulator